VIETREGLSELERAGLGATIREPGVHPVAWPKGWPSSPTAGELCVVLLTPFPEKRDGRIGSYLLGNWPGEAGVKAASPGAARPLPRGFIKVTKATASTRVSANFRLADFLTNLPPDVWPKYLVLDLKLVDKLELVIAALNEAGHPAKGLHVMSGFRTPLYNAKDVGPGARSAVSRHMYGDAADVYPDDAGKGRIDDLNGDGVVDLADARILADAADAVERKYPDLAGGIGVYPATAAHGPVVHVDTGGRRARW
jgi:uncharacterized protein YcbK (DUF882 family)